MPVPTLSSLFSLSGRAAIVTGAGHGIGRAIAVRLAEAGASVLVADVADADAAETARRITAAGGRATSLHADLAKVADAQRAVSTCVNAFGAVDVVVNNAGIFPSSPALQTTEELWDRVMAVNLKGAFFLTQAAARWMVGAKRAGVVVNVASIDAYHPTGGLVHYDASKAGMVMMTRSLATELGGAGIRVCGVAPGGIHTPGADAAMSSIAGALGMGAEQMTAGFVQRVPLGRMGEPDDIAAAVVFLASPAAGYVTGATLIVDGGYLTR